MEGLQFFLDEKHVSMLRMPLLFFPISILTDEVLFILKNIKFLILSFKLFKLPLGQLKCFFYLLFIHSVMFSMCVLS